MDEVINKMFEKKEIEISAAVNNETVSKMENQKNILKIESWKQYTWYLFHIFALGYDDKYRDKYIDFFESMRTIIPCKECKKNYIYKMDKDGDWKQNICKEKIFDWTVGLHNNVNKMQGKEIWTYDKARVYYEHCFRHFEMNKLKFFMFEMIKYNFKKGHQKMYYLKKMFESLCYIYHIPEKRDKLIDFSSKFEIQNDKMNMWLFAFLSIVK